MVSFLICFFPVKNIKPNRGKHSEKVMAPHSSTLAWKIPWTEEPGGLQSMGSLRVGHDWATSLSLFTFMHWRRKWRPTPVFLPGESQVRRDPGRLPSMGSHRVGHDWRDLAAAAAAWISFVVVSLCSSQWFKITLPIFSFITSYRSFFYRLYTHSLL